MIVLCPSLEHLLKWKDLAESLARLFPHLTSDEDSKVSLVSSCTINAIEAAVVTQILVLCPEEVHQLPMSSYFTLDQTRATLAVP